MEEEHSHTLAEPSTPARNPPSRGGLQIGYPGFCRKLLSGTPIQCVRAGGWMGQSKQNIFQMVATDHHVASDYHLTRGEK